jgi:tetratricopeptide (TPR) repeat protein
VAYTSEIEKLERRYAENPKGRNFAPLADAYRKAGQLDQAVELCTSGLEHHPDYVSAHIVYGRCLIDQHEDDKAAAVFRKVLELDPENVIAFKVLAEIGTRSGRPEEAAVWLTKLLAADPMNGDAAEALAVAKGKVAQAAKATTPVKPVVPPISPAELELPDIVLEPDTPPSIDLRTEAQRPSDIEFFDGTIDFSSVSSSSVKAEGIEIHEEIVLQPREEEVEGLAHTQYEASGMFKLDPPRDEDDLAVDLPLIMPDPESTGAGEDVAAPAPASAAPRGAAPGRWTPAPAGGSAAAVDLSDDDGAADTAALSRVEPVLTETMAELYLKQGHQEEALRVYQALQAQRPDDRRLRAKVESLSGRGKGDEGRGTEAMPSGQTAQAFLQGILGSRPGAASPPAVERERPGASPLDSAFDRAAPDPEPPGEPSRAAADDLSLEQVFGDDPPRPGRSSVTGSATPPPSVAAAPGGAGGGFSFDEFFSAGGAPESGGSPPASSSVPRASDSRARPPLEEDGDLDQFQSWLKGLKT